MAELTKDEAQLLAVHRAIKALDSELLNVMDVGEVLFGIEILGDLATREGNFTAKDIKIYLQGVVAGIAASRALQAGLVEPNSHDYYEELSQTISGGPTGGVVAGQGESEDFITQTGPREDQEVE